MSHGDARISISWTHFLKYMILIAHNSSSATRSACDQLGFLSPRCQPILVSLLVALPLRRETCLAGVAFFHRTGWVLLAVAIATSSRVTLTPVTSSRPVSTQTTATSLVIPPLYVVKIIPKSDSDSEPGGSRKD